MTPTNARVAAMFTSLVTAAAVFGLLDVARAADVTDLETELSIAYCEATLVAAAIARDDRQSVRSSLAAAQSAVSRATILMVDDEVRGGLGRRPERTDAKLTKLAERLAELATLVETEDVLRSELLRLAKRAAKSARKAFAKPRKKSRRGPDTRFSRGSAPTILVSGKTVRIRVRTQDGPDGEPCTEAPVVRVDDANQAFGALFDKGDGRYRLSATDAPGGAVVTVTSCGRTLVLAVASVGPKQPLDDTLDPVAPPSALSYTSPAPSYRTGTQIELNAPATQGGAPTSFTVSPPLPAGLALDSGHGFVSGTPTAPALRATYTVTAANDSGSVDAELSIQVTPALPEGVEFLEDGLSIEHLFEGLAVPNKMAVLPGGRLLFNELRTGRTRVISAAGRLLNEPFATTDVEVDGERGLLGLAVSPTFGSDSHVFVYAIAPAAGPQPVRGQVVRYTANGDVGESPTVIVDDLPAAIIHNAGDLQFGPDGLLYVSVGDANDATLAQTDGSLAGRILRFEPDGGIPATNPVLGSPEFARGLRNTFDLAFHPTAGTLYGSENGPTFQDELNYIQPEKNFEWGPVPPELPPALLGLQMTEWTPVIVPTGITFLHGGGAFGVSAADTLFLCEYDEPGVRRLPLSGGQLSDIDDEITLVRWDDSGGVANKPLDAVEGPDGSLWVSTFDGIWSIRPFEPPAE